MCVCVHTYTYIYIIGLYIFHMRCQVVNKSHFQENTFLAIYPLYPVNTVVIVFFYLHKMIDIQLKIMAVVNIILH